MSALPDLSRYACQKVKLKVEYPPIRPDMQANRRDSARRMSRQSANEYPTVEVVNMVQRRRWTLAEKIRIVAEASQPGMSVSYVAHQYGIAPTYSSGGGSS